MRKIVRAGVILLVATYAFVATANVVTEASDYDYDYSFDGNFVVAGSAIPLPEPPVTLYNAPGASIRCSCILYVKGLLGVTESWGHAKNLKPNSFEPKIGSVVITREGPGHVALIVDIKDGKLILNESNYVKCKITKGRELPIDSPLIRGYLAI